MPNGDIIPDSLTRAIESVQEAIRHDGRTIGANETRTRNTLIDPLLKALGWADPSVLTQEYVVNYQEYAKNRAIDNKSFRPRLADYALHQQDNPGRLIAFIEAKKMRDDLTDGDRDQVLGYAKERNVQHFILTNGDRWELYEKGNPRPICSLSIRNQPASECANLLLDRFPKPPGFETAGSANRPEVAIPIASESNALSRAPETNVIPSSGWTSGVDVPKALTWFAVSLISFGILGWTIGLSIAQPIENLFAAIGIVAVLGVLIVAVIVFRRYFPSAVPKAIKALRMKLFAPINGDRRKTRTWVAGTTFCGSGLGFLFGYPLGNSMADFITESLSIFGILFILVIIIIGPISISRKKKKGQ